jgi:hypothetical protein
MSEDPFAGLVNEDKQPQPEGGGMNLASFGQTKNTVGSIGGAQMNFGTFGQ